MKHWKDIAFGLFVSLTLAACYGEEDSFATPDIYKDYQPVLKDGNTVAGYAAAPLKEAKYDEVLNDFTSRGTAVTPAGKREMNMWEWK